jgi:hypothetical protein
VSNCFPNRGSGFLFLLQCVCHSVFILK